MAAMVTGMWGGGCGRPTSRPALALGEQLHAQWEQAPLLAAPAAAWRSRTYAATSSVPDLSYSARSQLQRTLSSVLLLVARMVVHAIC